MKKLLALSAAVVLLSGQVASAALKINEIYFSPEDPKDDRQFFEVISDVGVESLDNVWLLEVEGDQPIGVGDNPGLVLNAFDLSGFSTGTNGLFLWRDSSTVLDNSSDPGVQGPAPSGLHTEAFNQIFGYEGEDDDFANNVHTFLLVQDYTGADPTTPQGGAGPGPDLDSDDDGVLDSMPWSAVLDGIAPRKKAKLDSNTRRRSAVSTCNRSSGRTCGTVCSNPLGAVSGCSLTAAAATAKTPVSRACFTPMIPKETPAFKTASTYPCS